MSELTPGIVVDPAELEVARGAADRWKARAAVRDGRARAIADGRLLDADTSERIAARINRLTAGASRSAVARGLSSPMAAAAAAPVTAHDLANRSEMQQRALVEEALIGVQNYLSVEFLDRGAVAARTVGRVVILDGGGPRPLGTGFLIASGVIITNHHVLPDIDRARACGIQMDFVSQVGPGREPQLYVFEPDRLFINDKALDYAVVAVAPRSDTGKPVADYRWNPLDGGPGKITVLPDDFLNIVQHPLGRPMEVVIRDNHVLDLRAGAGETAAAAMGPFIHYEGDTDHGSSGSPVFNDQWEVVALHHMGVAATNDAGQFLDKDGKVWDEASEPIERIKWIANEGVRVSSLVAALLTVQVGGEARALLNDVLAGAAPGAATAAAMLPPTISTLRNETDAMAAPKDASLPAARASSGSITFDVPLRVTISLGDGAADARVQPGDAPADEVLASAAAEPVDPPSHFDGRAGYRPDFLGGPIPLPTIKARPIHGRPLHLIKPPRTGDPAELKYARFSVIMNAARRLAYLSAVNVDFAAAVNAQRTSRDKWARDGRIPLAAQVDGPYYFKNDYDKGHLTRRADGAWGQTEADAALANADTFHYTNAAPQHKFFNQSDAFTHKHLKLWGDLEDFISKQGAAQRTKLSIFNGPVFAGNDKPLKDILVPRAFFKIVVWHDVGQASPGAVGFVLEQTDLIARLPEEAIDPGEFTLRQRRISAIQSSVDVNFGPIVAIDRFQKAPVDVTREGLDIAPDDNLIETLEDIRL